MASLFVSFSITMTDGHYGFGHVIVDGLEAPRTNEDVVRIADTLKQEAKAEQITLINWIAIPGTPPYQETA